MLRMLMTSPQPGMCDKGFLLTVTTPGMRVAVAAMKTITAAKYGFTAVRIQRGGGHSRHSSSLGRFYAIAAEGQCERHM